jgi:hypothetical protein
VTVLEQLEAAGVGSEKRCFCQVQTGLLIKQKQIMYRGTEVALLV